MEWFFANLPFVLLLLVCPLSMIFMMRMGGHGGHADHEHHHHDHHPDEEPAVRRA